MPLYNPPLATPVSIANGGTNNGALAVTAGGVVYTDGSKLVNVGAGTSGQILTSSGSSAPTWAAAPAAGPLSVVTANSTLSISLQNYYILSGASFTATLPTAVGATGATVTLYHNGTSGTQVYTIARTSSQTINGINADFTLFHNGQWVQLMSDGANWLIIDQYRVVSVIAYKNGGSVTTGADVVFTETEDYAGIMSSGVVTIPNHFAGLYAYATAMGTTTGTPAPRLMLNGAEYQAGVSAGGQSGTMLRTVRVAVNDTLSVRPSSNLTLASSDTATTFSLWKIGD